MPVTEIKDGAWKKIEALLPPPKPRRRKHPGRLPKSDRDVLNGILYILQNGIAFDQLPQKLGYGSGMTCWNRLTAWKLAKVWPKLQKALIKSMPRANKLDWSRIERLNTRKRSKRPGGR